MLNKKEILKLVSKLNKDDRNRIKGAYKMKKADLMQKIQSIGYNIDHDNKKLVPKTQMVRRKTIKL